jgi:hypothetical protein
MDADLSFASTYSAGSERALRATGIENWISILKLGKRVPCRNRRDSRTRLFDQLGLQ